MSLALRSEPVIAQMQQTIAKLTAERAHLRKLAYTDELTELYNRRAGDRIINRLIGKGTPFVLFSLDLKEFKPINDTAGHEAGDLVLKALANSFRASVDYVIRQGGDEFCAIALCESVEAKGIYYRLKCAAVSTNLDSCLPADLKMPRCETSVGWASSDESDNRLELMKLADQRMYEDKGSDRR